MFDLMELVLCMYIINFWVARLNIFNQATINSLLFHSQLELLCDWFFFTFLFCL
eukprot:m.175437 g.175437  ORF g.175437 m.175437 type:complete len:54 (+) comp16547_c2_seq12:2302-2463(+)